MTDPIVTKDNNPSENDFEDIRIISVDVKVEGEPGVYHVEHALPRDVVELMHGDVVDTTIDVLSKKIRQHRSLIRNGECKEEGCTRPRLRLPEDSPRHGLCGPCGHRADQTARVMAKTQGGN